MLRSFASFIVLAVVFCSCGSKTGEQQSRDTAITGNNLQLPGDKLQFTELYAGLVKSLPVLQIPSRIDVDSIGEGGIPLTHDKVALLFPPNFGVPDEVNVSAFAKHDIDSATHAIWYKMHVSNSQNMDIWVVLYNDSAGPLAVNCPSTKGIGYGYARIESPTFLKEAFVEEGEKTTVTTKLVNIANNTFVISDEKTSTFGPDNLAAQKTQALIESFFR